MAVWVVGIPLFTFLVLHQNSALLRNASVKKKYGFLYNGFHARSYYWEVVSILRKEAVAAISVFLLQQGTVVQSMLLLLTMAVFVLLTIRVAPYERPQLNRLELQSLLALSLTAFVGLFYLASKDRASEFYEHGKDCKLPYYDASHTERVGAVGAAGGDCGRELLGAGADRVVDHRSVALLDARGLSPLLRLLLSLPRQTPSEGGEGDPQGDSAEPASRPRNQRGHRE